MVIGATGQNRQNDPGIFIGERDGHYIGVSPIAHPFDPQASRICFASCFPKNSTSTMDQQGTQVSVSAFADPEQAGSTTTGALFGNEPKPGRKLPSVLEAGTVTDRGYKRRRRDWPDPFDFANTLAQLVGPKKVSDTLCVSCNALIQFIEFFTHVADQFDEQRAQHVINAVGNLRQCTPDP